VCSALVGASFDEGIYEAEVEAVEEETGDVSYILSVSGTESDAVVEFSL
jgi:hypothetical protein